MPTPGQKGTGKKGGAGAVNRQRSRNTTPMSASAAPSTSSIPPIDIVETEFLDLRLESMRSISYDDLVDPSAANAVIPDAKSLDGLITRLGKLNEIIERRGSWCDKGMRLVALQRKNHFDEMARGEARGAEGEGDGEKKASKKKRKANDSLAPPHEKSGTSR
jgi:transcriptional adapter 3